MPNVEEEFSKLNEEITRFLTEEGGVDSGDEDLETSTGPRARPGSITPLGVRVDRGAGLLGVNGVNSTIGEMDSVLNNIRAWKQKHEREMLELRQRNEQALSQVTDAIEQRDREPQSDSNHQPAGACASSAATSASGTPSAAALLPLELAAARADVPQSIPGTPAEQCPNQHREELQQGADKLPPPPLERGKEDDEDLAALLRERRERVLLGSAVARLRLVAASPAADQAPGELAHRTDTDAEPQPGRLFGGGSGGASSQPLFALGQAPLGSVLRASVAGPALPHLFGHPLPAERPTTAARRKAEEDARGVLLRGQQLLAELEAELQELEGGGGGDGDLNRRGSGNDGFGTGCSETETSVSFWESDRPRSGGTRGGTGNGAQAGNGSSDDDGCALATGGAPVSAAGSTNVESLMDWSAQLQGVLAKMDALQTGYQAAIAAAAASLPDSGGVGSSSRAGAGAGASSPGSGGTRTGPAASTGALGGSVLVLRQGSARLRLEPLSRAPCLPAGGAPGQGQGPGLATNVLSSSSQSSAFTPSMSSAVTGLEPGAEAAVEGPDGGGEVRGPRSRGPGPSGATGHGEPRRAPAQQGTGGGGGGEDAETATAAGAVACAGHRIRQLRELQRHGAGGISAGTGAGGTSVDVGARGVERRRQGFLSHAQAKGSG